MTEHDPHAGAVRDVPPPRPVAGRDGPSRPPVEESAGPLGRAARAVADVVTGLLGTGPAGERTGEERRVSATALRDLGGAVAGAVGAWRSRRTGASEPHGERPETSPGAFLGELLSAAVPRLPIRDRARLRQAYPGATDDDEIADALVARSARLTAGIGAATGGLSAIQWFATPSLVALPVELGVETVLVAAVEVVLLGELHELYGHAAQGDGRAGAYLSSWSTQRALDQAAGPGLVSVLGSAGLHALRRRLTRRVARSVPSAAPFFLGAALGGRGNRKATEALARRVLTDLRADRGAGGAAR